MVASGVVWCGAIPLFLFLARRMQRWCGGVAASLISLASLSISLGGMYYRICIVCSGFLFPPLSASLNASLIY